MENLMLFLIYAIAISSVLMVGAVVADLIERFMERLETMSPHDAVYQGIRLINPGNAWPVPASITERKGVYV